MGVSLIPADDHELDEAGVLAELPPDVHGEDGAAAVKDGGERGHERRHHDGQHEAARTRGHQLDHQQRVRHVGAARRLITLL